MAWAQTETPTVPPDAQEQIRQEVERVALSEVGRLREADNEGVGEGLGVGDVVDRALDMIETFATRATTALENIAPEAWRILLRQQYVEGVLCILIPLMFLFLAAAYWKIVNSSKSLDQDMRFWVGRVIPIISFVMVGVALAIYVPHSIARFINPEFYAIQDILEALRPAVNR
ncbi:hypothetical protein KKF05_03060 [Patescibacteria group bacterium]|nr:hypothetical protein [Patescibacteria group bacterium]